MFKHVVGMAVPVFIAIVAGIAVAAYVKYQERRMLKKLKDFFSYPDANYEANQEFINKLEGSIKNRSLFLQDYEIPPVAEHAIFYVAGNVKGKGIAVMLVDRRIGNA